VADANDPEGPRILTIEEFKAELALEAKRAAAARKLARPVRERHWRLSLRQYPQVHIIGGRYEDGNPCVYLLTAEQEPLAVLSVNLPEHAHQLLDTDHFFCKCWSENEAIAAELLGTSLFEDTGGRVATGFVEAQVWRWKAGT
jgi:hypothetical protein